MASADPVIRQLVGISDATLNKSKKIKSVICLFIMFIWKKSHTLFEDIHVAEFQKVVAIVIVCDIDPVILSQWILHPSTLITTECIVCDGL